METITNVENNVVEATEQQQRILIEPQQFRFTKSNLYRIPGTFEYDDDRFYAHFTTKTGDEEHIDVEWSHVTALALEYNPFVDCKLFLELENRMLIKNHKRRCLYLTFEDGKDFIALETFLKAKGMDRLPRPHRYQTRYPLLKIYSKRMRMILQFFSMIMNIIMMLLLIVNAVKQIDKWTGIFTSIQTFFINFGDWFTKMLPTVSSAVSVSAKPGVKLVVFIKYLIDCIDDISDVIFYLITYVFYIYSYWKVLSKSLQLPKLFFFWLADKFDKARDKCYRKRLQQQRDLQRSHRD